METSNITIEVSQIADILIGLRLKDMRKRHNLLIFYEITDAAKSPESITESGASLYLPPRRQWMRIRKEDRERQTHESATRQSIKRCVMAHYKAKTLVNYDWGNNLLQLQAEINDCFRLPQGYKFSRPVITPIPKGSKANTNSLEEYRVTASCANISDRVLSSIISRQLQNHIESEIPPCCYSFRANGTTLHDAIANLKDYREEWNGKKLYAAECDIRGFFDSVPHHAINKSIKMLLQRKSITLPEGVSTLLHKLMDSYSYPDFGLQEARKQLEAQGVRGIINWLKEDEQKKIYGTIPDSKIGIPQGNPVSPIYANAVLVEADEAVLSILGNAGFYARYCDDIIIIHPVKKICSEALDAYLDVLKKSHIPAHPPKIVCRYDRKYFSMKSKKPYLWSNPANTKSAVPWIQFVGYQLRYDGLLRIRKKSLIRQKQSIQRIISQTQGLIKRAERDNCSIKVSGKTLYAKITARIIRSGTGDRRIKSDSIREPEPCWVDAFPLIEQNRFSKSQMRQLDRTREIQFRYLRHWLKKKGYWSDTPNGDNDKKDHLHYPAAYHGAPYSYFGVIGDSAPRIKRTMHGGYNA